MRSVRSIAWLPRSVCLTAPERQQAPSTGAHFGTDSCQVERLKVSLLLRCTRQVA
jgi:hypothetical protein